MGKYLDEKKVPETAYRKLQSALWIHRLRLCKFRRLVFLDHVAVGEGVGLGACEIHVCPRGERTRASCVGCGVGASLLCNVQKRVRHAEFWERRRGGCNKGEKNMYRGWNKTAYEFIARQRRRKGRRAEGEHSFWVT